MRYGMAGILLATVLYAGCEAGGGAMGGGNGGDIGDPVTNAASYPFFTVAGTNYIPVHTERWPAYAHREALNVMDWHDGGAAFSLGTGGTPAEGVQCWQAAYNTGSGWWGFGTSFVTTNGGFACKRVNMNGQWNWYLSFSVKGAPVSGDGVVVGIQSGVYNDGDSQQSLWRLSELGYAGTGGWERLTIPFAGVTNINWSAITFLFLVANRSGATGSDTLAFDDVCWWVDAASHGQTNTNAVPDASPAVVRTNVDPQYVITYQNTKFVPPEGRVLFIAGQDKNSIPAYVAAFGQAGGYASYWAVCDPRGLTNDLVQNENGHVDVQNLAWLMETYPGTVAQSAMWIVGKAKGWDDYCSNVTNGVYDNVLDTFTAWAVAAAIPVYLRIGYEFDGPHNMLDPVEYINAYRYIVDRIRAGGGDNVAFVWHSYASTPYLGHAVSEWYPGDTYVDWVGVSVFIGHFVDGTAVAALDNVIDLAKGYKKPVMVAESTPNGGIIPDTYRTWNRWFAPLFCYMYEKNIKAFSYINCDWNAVSVGTPEWGDTRIQNFPLVRQCWTNEIGKARYLKHGPGLFGELGFAP